MSIYTKSSPYFSTDYSKGYLDIINFRNIPSETDDIYYQITKQFEYRPDLLAYKLYADPKLWWVFAVRNKSTIKDPIFDFVSGTSIYLPKITTLRSSLGIA